MDDKQRIDALEACLLDALEWFEDVIGHDGAPDGGDPGWVHDVTRLIAEPKSWYGPDWFPILEARQREHRARKAEAQRDQD